MTKDAATAAPSELQLAKKWDRCITNFIIQAGTGVAIGAVLSVVLFKKQSWPLALSFGAGAGMAYRDCQYDFANPDLFHGKRIPKPTATPASPSPADAQPAAH